MVPLAVIFFIGVLFFLYAMKWGIIRLMAGAIGITCGLAVFFTVVNMAPKMIREALDFGLTWEFSLVAAGILAIITYFITWAISGFILRFMFNPDSFLHPLVAGVPGAFLSLIPTLVMAFFVITANRVAGTFFELQHVATIAQPTIVTADLDKLPPPSKFTVWRNQTEQIPYVADLLDKIDPFSRRESRSVGIVTLFTATQPARDYSEGSSQMGAILSSRKVRELINSEDTRKTLELKDNVGLVLNSEAQEVAVYPEVRSRLKNLKVDRHIDEFVQYLKTNKTPGN